jgi:hypothetical protein
MDELPMVTRVKVLSMQVCVPKDWNDDQVVNFAEKENPCGTTAGWGIIRQGDERLQGTDARVQCVERPTFVHVCLGA